MDVVMRRVLAALVVLGTLILGVPVSAAGAAVPGPAGAPEYWFARWDVTQLWASGARGQGVRIAVIDTGVNAALPALHGRVLAGTDFGEAGDGQTDRDSSTFGHGTAMASIMVARPGLLGITGLAPDAKILPVAVPLDGTTDANRPDRLAAAIDWAADHGADIINLSVGGKQYPQRSDIPCPAAEQQAVFHAIRSGAVVLAAVGNTGPTANTVEDPASCLGVVSVGAVDRQGAVASFSSRQPYLTLVGPGVDIPSLGRAPGSAFAGDGTSQATAIVSASLALAKSAHPSLTNTQLVARLLATLDDRASTPIASTGYGEVNARNLVRENVPTTSPNPVAAAAAPFLRRYVALQKANADGGHGARKSAREAASESAPPAARDAGDQLRDGLALAAVGLIVLVGVGELSRRRRAAAPRG